MQTFDEETTRRHAGMLANRVLKRMKALEKGFRKEGIEAFLETKTIGIPAS